jgi:hypothetical protein
MRLDKLWNRSWWGERLYREEWNVAVVDQTAEDIVRRGIVRQPQWLRIEEGVMMADPSCLELRGGGRVLLVERMDFRVGRGEIWSAVIPDRGKPELAVFRRWLSAAIHLSYPFPFEDEDGNRFLTAESSEGNNLFFWRQHREQWVLSGQIMLNQPAVDPTLWRGTDRWWLFCGLRDEAPDERLHLFYADQPAGPWSPHPENPIKIDAASSRPAGPLFRANGVLIRPAQDCSKTYGGAVVLNVVSRLDSEGYSETALRRLEPTGREYPHGLHTICPAGSFTLIDGKRWSFRPLELLSRPLLKGKSLMRRRASAREQTVSMCVKSPELSG